jgi:hypothetical protein
MLQHTNQTFGVKMKEEFAMSLQLGKLMFGTALLLSSVNLSSAAVGCIGQCDSQRPTCREGCTTANRDTSAASFAKFAQSTDEQKRKWKDKQRDCVERGNCPK